MNDFDAYQVAAMGTRTGTANDMYALLNLSGEVGELHGLIAKAIRDGQKPDYHVNILKELGDILWHVAAIADDHGFNLSYVANQNIEKLASRKARGVIAGSGDNR